MVLKEIKLGPVRARVMLSLDIISIGAEAGIFLSELYPVLYIDVSLANRKVPPGVPLPIVVS